MPLVSVVIPTYNHSRFVLQTLESVRGQTFTDYEVIVVNDGSPDDTSTLLKPAADRGEIQLIEQENQGQAAARNRGLAAARGKYIAFLDDDDLWPADKLQWQVEMIGSVNAAVVGGEVQRLGAAGRLDRPADVVTRLTLADVFAGCPFASPGQTLIRAEALRRAGGFDSSLWGTDDYDLWMRLAASGGIIRSERIALLYREHEHNASRDAGRMLRNGSLAVRKNAALGDARQRSALRRAGNRFLYLHYGNRLVERAGSDFRRVHLLRFARGVFGLRPVWRAALTDPGLWPMIARDLCPPLLRRWMGRFRSARQSPESVAANSPASH